jgi:hypothetical protein
VKACEAVKKSHVPPCSREEQKNYIGKIYPPGGMQIKKIGGGSLRYVLMPICGYFNRGRGVKVPGTNIAKRRKF